MILKKVGKRFRSQRFLLGVTLTAIIAISPSNAFASAGTMKLIDALTDKWSSNINELEATCRLGRKINHSALSFWNHFIGGKRLKAFESNLEEMKLYVDDKKDLNDKDIVSAFVDAKEAGLLRAMRKQCPDVW